MLAQKTGLFSQRSVAFWVTEPDLETALMVLCVLYSVYCLTKINKLNLKSCAKKKKKKKESKENENPVNAALGKGMPILFLIGSPGRSQALAA
jgi:hypothetical protein